MNKVYAEQVIDPLKELFLQDEFNNIPDINIDTNSDLNLVSSNISSLSVNINENESEAEQIVDIFSSIGEYFQDDRNISILSTIDQTSKSFASVLEQSYTTLNSTIIPLVDSLKEKILFKYQELMVRDQADNLLTSTEPSESDYTFLNWNISSSDQHDIISTACENVNISSRELSPINLSYVIAKLAFTKEFADINLTNEVNAHIVEELCKSLDSIPPEYVKRFWRLVTNANDYVNFCSDIQLKLRSGKNEVQYCLEFIEFIRLATIFINVVKRQVADDLNGDTLQDIANNVDTFIKTLYGIKYWIVFLKEIRFKGNLILDSTIINGETYADFLKEGKTVSDIYKYLKAFFYNVQIPKTGIALASVISADVDEKLSKINDRIKSNETFIRSKNLIAAYQFVISRFVQDEAATTAFPSLSEQSMKLAFIKLANANATILAGNQDNIDNALYLTIINLFYNNSLVGTLYKYLGKNFSDLVDTEGDLDNDIILKSQCSAVIELLVDFFFDKGICGKA